jgi:hypothetical protein
LDELQSIPFEPSLRGTTTLAVGNLAIAPCEPSVAALRSQEVELLRGNAYPIGDEQWGTETTPVILGNDGPIEKQVELPGDATGDAATPTWADDAEKPLCRRTRLPPYAIGFSSPSNSPEWVS